MAKKIGAIVSLSIIGILILATIIMANISVDYKINCATPTSVWVQNKSAAELEALDNSNKIIGYINGASKENSLTALFNGTLGKKAKIVAESSVGKTIPTATGYYVRYRYENAQKLKYGDDVYKDSNNNEVTYQDLVFTVNNMEGTNMVKVYVVPNSAKSNVYTHYYNLEADFTDLYKFLSENY